MYRPARTHGLPRTIPCLLTPPTPHNRLSPRTRLNSLSSTNSSPSRCHRSPLLVPPRKRCSSNPSCGGWHPRQYGCQYFSISHFSLISTTLTASRNLRPHISRYWHLHLPRRCTGYNNCHWRPLKSPTEPQKYPSVRDNQYLARIVRLPCLPLFNSYPFQSSCAFAYLAIMAFVVLRILNETKPMWYYSLAAALFIISQLAWFLLGRVLCNVCCSFSSPSFIHLSLSELKSESRRFNYRYRLRNSFCRRLVLCLEEHNRRSALFFSTLLPLTFASRLLGRRYPVVLSDFCLQTLGTWIHSFSFFVVVVIIYFMFALRTLS